MITLFALPGLCQQCFRTWAWQTEQQGMPKQFWLLDSEGQNFSTANNGQSLTAITHKSSWTQNSVAYCGRKEASCCPPVFRVMQNLWNHKWRWTYSSPTKTLASSIPASMFRALCLIQPYIVVEAVGRAQALPCWVALRWQQSSGWLLSHGSVVLEGKGCMQHFSCWRGHLQLETVRLSSRDANTE